MMKSTKSLWKILEKVGEAIMSDVKKIATRDSYGNALAELGTEHEDVVVLDADLAAATKTGVFKKASSGASYRLRYCGVQHDGRGGRPGVQPAWFRLQAPLRCLRQGGHLSR